MKYKRKYSLLFVISFVVLMFFVGDKKGRQVHRTREVLSMAYIGPHEKQHWTILMTVNDGYFDFFQNWINFYNKLQLNNPIIVVAEDDLVFKKLQKQKGKPVFKLVRSWRISLNLPVMYMTKGFKKLVSVRPSYILKYLENGTNILYADTDSVWLQDPFPFFNGTYDMWMQVDGQPDNLCTGFMAIKSNSKTIKLMKLWETSLNQRLDINQPAFSRVYKDSNVVIKKLDTNLFPSGQQFFEEFSDVERNHVVVVHNNYINGHDKKLARFKKFNLWSPA